ncbi:MAG: hypothetical protein ACR2LN_06215 [Candidatus Levyibacteriota bacterium]
MDNFESQFQPERKEGNPLEENLVSYFQKYDSELVEKYGEDEYRKKLEEIELKLRCLPIAHSTNIKDIVPILQSGLKPFSHRGEKNYAKSAIFKYDHQYGLDNYVFAEIGHCPSYGPEKGRVTILIDDSVAEQSGSFFTFHDLTGVLLASEQHRQREERYTPDPYADRIKQQYYQSKLPLSAAYGILARTFLKSGKTLEQFFQDKYTPFPPAYDPDFTNTNHGSPEIKIGGVVSPDKFIGYVVKDEETRQALLVHGIAEEKIILSTDPTQEKKLIYDYKKNLSPSLTKSSEPAKTG